MCNTFMIFWTCKDIMWSLFLFVNSLYLYEVFSMIPLLNEIIINYKWNYRIKFGKSPLFINKIKELNSKSPRFY